MNHKLCFFCTFIFTVEDDLDTVVDELHDIADVERLGLSLGIRMSALKKIKIEYPDLEGQKTNIVYCWLQRRDIVRHKQNEHPTWGGLADAVDKVNPSLSETIRRKYC